MKMRTGIFLIWAVLLAATGLHAPPLHAAEGTSARFGGVLLNIPKPPHLCPIGDSEAERIAYEHQRQTQASLGNKLLAYWINCDVQKLLQEGHELPNLKDWFIVVGTLTGNPIRERVYPNVSRLEFQKQMLKATTDLDVNRIVEQADKKISSVNEEVLGDRNAVNIGSPVNLGVLSVTESIHTGLLMRVKALDESQLISLVLSSAIVKGIITNFMFYSEYENEHTIRDLLKQAETYSSRIHAAN